jgi:FkbM family methyltransferase
MSNAMLAAGILPKVVAGLSNWPMYFLDYFGLTRPGLITYKLRNGTRLTARAQTADRWTITEIWMLKRYEPWPDTILPGSTVIDIGAHIGIFSIRAAERSPSIRVYAYEPLPEHCEMLEHNLRQNGLNNVRLFRAAVDGKPGDGKLFLSPAKKETGAHSLVNFSSSQYVPVKRVTLPQVFEANNIEKCDLLKMDCEGTEYSIFENLPPAYFKRINKIVMEWHDVKGHNPQQIAALLQRHGFSTEIRGEYLFARRLAAADI